MSDAKATAKLPWKYDDKHGQIIDADVKIVAFCSAARAAYDGDAQSQFELIALAVNQHDAINARNKKLAEALEEIKMRCSYTEEHYGFVNLAEQIEAIFKLTKAALTENKEQADG